MSVCRLTVQTERGSDSCTVDIALPGDTPVVALLPAIVSLSNARSATEDAVADWRLDRLSGKPIDGSMTLFENDIRDGELLLLSSDRKPSPPILQWDPCRTVASAATQLTDVQRIGPAIICSWTAVLASIALAWSGSGSPDGRHLITSAVGATLVAGAALAIKSIELRLSTVCLVAVTGYLAVPSAPCAAGVFLAASAGCSTSILMLRSAGGLCPPSTTVTLVASATTCALAAIATLAPAVHTMSIAAVGATLATASIALLAIAPRLAIPASGLRPDEHQDDCDVRANLAHAMLTGLVIGCCAGAAIGAAVVAIGCQGHDRMALACTAYTAVVGAALSLRARSYPDGPRWAALFAGGICSLTAAFAIIIGAAPAYAWSSSALVIAVGVFAASHRTTTPRVARMVEVLEYTVLAAALPLAFWVGGVYAFVREFHLP